MYLVNLKICLSFPSFTEILNNKSSWYATLWNTGTRFYYLVNIIADDDISVHGDGLAPPSNVLNAAGL